MLAPEDWTRLADIQSFLFLQAIGKSSNILATEIGMEGIMAKSKSFPGRETRTKLFRTNSRLVSAYLHTLLAVGKVATVGMLTYLEFAAFQGELGLLQWVGYGLAFWACRDLARTMGYWYWWRSGVNVLSESYDNPQWIRDLIEKQMDCLSRLLTWKKTSLINRALLTLVKGVVLVLNIVALAIPFVLWDSVKDKPPRIYTQEEVKQIEGERAARRKNERMLAVLLIFFSLSILLILLWRIVFGGLK